LIDGGNGFFFSKGVDDENAAWQHSSITITESFSETEMMRITFIHQPTKRPALGSCFAQGLDRLVMDRSPSGRTTE